MIYNLLFPQKPYTTKVSLLLLAVRIIFGLLLLSHGIDKWTHFQEYSSVFNDPLGVGSSVSLGLSVFAELVCSLGFIFGVLYRLALIPMIFNMSVAFFVIHGGDPFAVKELALVYLVVFVLMLIAGPGKFAIDNIFVKMFVKNKKRQTILL